MSKAPAKHINFMAPRKVLGILSIALVVISIALLATRGLNLGLDFTGGTSVVVKSEQDLDLDQVRGAVAELRRAREDYRAPAARVAEGRAWLDGETASLATLQDKLALALRKGGANARTGSAGCWLCRKQARRSTTK